MHTNDVKLQENKANIVTFSFSLHSGDCNWRMAHFVNFPTYLAFSCSLTRLAQRECGYLLLYHTLSPYISISTLASILQSISNRIVTTGGQYCVALIKRQIVMGDKVRLMLNSIWKHFRDVDKAPLVFLRIILHFSMQEDWGHLCGESTDEMFHFHNS